MVEVKAIFEPRIVALIGSSMIQEKVGMASPQLFADVTYNMKKFFRGKTIVLDLEGQKGCKSAKMFSELPDVAVIMLPPGESVVQAEKCAQEGVKAFVMITGGYKDQQRQQLLKLRDQYDLKILGPNTIMGIINTSNGLNTTFERSVMPKRGSIAVISQSGGVGSCMLDWACFYKVGISKFAFVGDKIDVDDVDLLRYFGEDEDTKVICLYIEGIRKGREFIEQARKIVKHKPLIVLKGGITQESARRARSHTASIAGSDEVYGAAFKKAGIIRVGNIEELMNTAIAFSKQPPMLGDSVVVVSNVGGPAILAGDAVAKSGLRLATLSKKVKREIESLYKGVDASNPIDMIADARSERYQKVLNLVMSDKNVDGVVVINMLKSTFFEPADAKILLKIALRYPHKPIVDVPGGGGDFAKVFKVLGNTDIPLYNLPDTAVKALKALRDYGKILGKR